VTATKIQRVQHAHRLLDVREVGEITNLSPRTVQRLAERGLMPPPAKIGVLVRWSRTAIESWIEQGCKPVISRNSNVEDS